MRRLLLLLVSLALAASACGGGDDGEVSAAPTIVVEGADASPEPEDTVPEDTVPEDAATETESTAETESAVDETLTTESTADATDEELAIAFASCMRDEGIDFPDPTVAADGSVQLLPPGGAANLGFDPNDPDFDAATDVCGPMLEGASFLPTGDDDLTELQDNLLLFAECLRDLGFDVDDPDLSGGFGGAAGLFGDGFDPTDPANAEAIQECQGVFGAGGPLGGGA